MGEQLFSRFFKTVLCKLTKGGAMKIALLVMLGGCLLFSFYDRNRPPLERVDQHAVNYVKIAYTDTTGPCLDACDGQLIHELLQVMKKAELDTGGHHFAEPTVTISFLGTKKRIICEVEVGGSVFKWRRGYYYDRSGELERIVCAKLQLGARVTGMRYKVPFTNRKR